MDWDLFVAAVGAFAQEFVSNVSRGVIPPTHGFVATADPARKIVSLMVFPAVDDEVTVERLYECKQFLGPHAISSGSTQVGFVTVVPARTANAFFEGRSDFKETGNFVILKHLEDRAFGMRTWAQEAPYLCPSGTWVEFSHSIFSKLPSSFLRITVDQRNVNRKGKVLS